MIARRVVALLLASAPLPALFGCAADGGAPIPVAAAPTSSGVYGAVAGERFPVAALDESRIGPEFRRTRVDWAGPESPGTVVVDPQGHHLYLVEEGGRAVRYGVAVGREGFLWSGSAEIGAVREWPDWHPTKEMMERRPDIAEQLVDMPNGPGVSPGPDNPLGARGMYLYRDGKDTLFRIHGTPEPYTVGTSVSSGCIRMTNQDAIDLYRKVRVGTRVVVLGPDTLPSMAGSAASRQASKASASGRRTDGRGSRDGEGYVPQEYVSER